MQKTLLAAAFVLTVAVLTGCASGGAAPSNVIAAAAAEKSAEDTRADNPFFAPWSDPFGAVAFDRIKTEHYAPALERGMAEQRVEIDAIAANPEPANFDNTIAQLERSGRLLDRTTAVFLNMTSSMSDDAIRKIQSEYAPKLAKHQSDILLNPALFARVKAVYENGAALGLDAEQQRVAERWYVQMERAGAKLDGKQRARVAEIDQRLATLSTQFSQNLLADTAAWTLTLDSEDDFAGLPQSIRDAAAATAKQLGKTDALGVITLQRPSVEPFLTFSARRDLREQAWKAWIARGDNGNEYDNKPLIAEIVRLRAERARIMGYASHAHFVLADSMAGSPDVARTLMERVWEPALARAREEQRAMEALIADEGGSHDLEGWDWRYYAEKVRKQRYDISQDEVRDYFPIDQIIAAQFYVANRLFGLTFTERTDVPVYHPDVRVWEVKEADGRHVGLFYGDYYARPSKQSGAWMSSFRIQEKFDGAVSAHVVNVLSIPKAPDGQPTTVSFDDATTMFHELGHALHGLLSDVNFPSIAGTAVPRDFVEFPAQFMEHYLTEPEILRQFARHKTTGQPIPEPLMTRIIESQKFNQGFATVEFLASAFVDTEFHLLKPEQAAAIDAAEFERATLKRIGMLDDIAMRHRSPHFAHVFAGGYSAGYYSYMWSEVLDADGFEAFKETGDIFNRDVARRLREHVFAAGNRQPPMAAYVAFRGREPAVEALLRNRGFLADGEAAKPRPGAG